MAPLSPQSDCCKLLAGSGTTETPSCVILSAQLPYYWNARSCNIPSSAPGSASGVPACAAGPRLQRAGLGSVIDVLQDVCGHHGFTAHSRGPAPALAQPQECKAGHPACGGAVRMHNGTLGWSDCTSCNVAFIISSCGFVEARPKTPKRFSAFGGFWANFYGTPAEIGGCVPPFKVLSKERHGRKTQWLAVAAGLGGGVEGEGFVRS